MSKISQRQFDEIGDQLELYASYLPSDISRRPRSLKFIDRFKVTEFRQFLLYTSVVALKSIVSDDVYNIFISLHIAISFLVSKDFIEFQMQYLVWLVRILLSFKYKQ